MCGSVSLLFKATPCIPVSLLFKATACKPCVLCVVLSVTAVQSYCLHTMCGLLCALATVVMGRDWSHIPRVSAIRGKEHCREGVVECGGREGGREG